MPLFSNGFMVTPQDISELNDEKTRECLTEIVKSICNLNSIIQYEVGSAALSKFLEPKSSIVCRLCGRSGDDITLDDMDFSNLVEILSGDINKFDHILEKKLNSHYKRYNKSYKSIGRDFSVYPVRLEKEESEDAISKARLPVYNFLSNENLHSYKNPGAWTALESNLKFLINEYNNQFGVSWKNIYEIEKYSNDNWRYTFNKITLVVSIVAIVFSTLSFLGFKPFSSEEGGRSRPTSIGRAEP